MTEIRNRDASGILKEIPGSFLEHLMKRKKKSFVILEIMYHILNMYLLES